MAKDVEETVVEETTPAPAEPVEEESTKDEKETKEQKEITEAKDEYFDDIEVLENDERGKFSLKVGDSTYYGQTKKEVILNLIQGKVESDTYIRKVKAEQKVKVPQLKEEDVPEVRLPNEREIYSKHIESVTKQHPDINMNMLRYGRDEWNAYQDSNTLRDHEISDLKREVREIITEAGNLTKDDMRVANLAYVNSYTIEKETPAVREMLADSGIDQDKFDYEEVLDTVMKKVGKGGEITPGMITAEAYKQINKIRKDGTPIKKDLQSVIDKAKEAKDKIKSPTNGERPKKEDNGFLSYDQIARSEKKQLEKIGRDI